MKVLITGGTGFIGTNLTKRLSAKGHEVIVVARHRPKQKGLKFIKADLENEVPQGDLERVDAVIHLVGRNIFGRWNRKLKDSIRDSRVKGARNILKAFENVKVRPKVFISASAVGYYGDKDNEELRENDAAGKDFLAKVCVDWEKSAQKAEDLGMRWVSIRTALVLGKGGLLGVMLPIFKLGLGGPLGNGKQWFPWIHIEDIVGIYEFVLEEKIHGVYNACAPGQITNEEFTKALGKALHRPVIFRVYKWMMRLVFGEFTDVIMASKKVDSSKIRKAGYKFKFLRVEDALEDLLA